MNLRYDPYQVFWSSKTPVGLYARQQWLISNDEWIQGTAYPNPHYLALLLQSKVMALIQICSQIL